MKLKVIDTEGRLVGPVEVPRVVKSDAEWRKQLSAEQFEIARGKGTENRKSTRLNSSHIQKSRMPSSA